MASVIRRIVSSSAAPKAIGPYSQAILVDKTLYVSGQIGLDPNSGKLCDGGTEGEARQALCNLENILKTAGCSFSNVVKCTVLLENMADFNVVNNIYKEYFHEPYPARVAYQVARLPAGAKIEIDAIAIVGQIEDKENLGSKI